ncbi:MAG: hypothetical protein ACLQBJ_11945 [Bryobacteraceae bacterium]
MQTRSKLRFDPDSPQIKAYLDQVHHHTFMGEGTMVAFPTCLPGMTVQFPLDESHITALAAAPDGTVYGATSGRRSHLFVASLHWLNGIVFDLGMPAGATHAAAVCCGDSSVFAFVNGPRGGRAISAPLLDLAPQDLIQEWGFERPELTDHGECIPGEPVVHAVMDASRNTIVGITSRHIFTMDPASPKARVLAEAPGSGRLAAGAHGVYGRDDGDSLWRFDAASHSLERRAVKLPDGFGDHALMWSTNHGDSLLYTADAHGNLFSFDQSHGFSPPLGRTPLTPVGPLGVTFDGRVFGFCGDEMAKMFCYDPATRQIANLGVAVSVIERRRYGYVFGDAVTGRDGEIIFGEDDNGGHVWMYFPRIRSTGA